MTAQGDGLDQLRFTAEEADRFLEALETEQERVTASPAVDSAVTSAQADVASHGVDDGLEQTTTSSGREAPHPGFVALVIAIVLSPLALLMLLQIGEHRSAESLPALRYASSCGSSPGPGKRWWPVLGPPSRSLLRTIRDQYCGDAYFTDEGSLQVASFDSWQGADRFRQQLDHALGERFSARFRVGEVHR